MAFRRTAWFVACLLFLSLPPPAVAGGTVTWTMTGGPVGGLVNALVVETNPPTLFAGTSSGVYRSRDAGAHWQAVSIGLPSDRTIYALALSADSKTVYAGTPDGVYISRDSGAHWQIASPSQSGQTVLSLWVEPAPSGAVYAGTLTTLWRSADGGKTWSEIGQELKTRVWAVAPAPDGSALFVATDSGIFTSTDLGAKWKPSSEGLATGARVQALVTTPRGLLAGTTLGLYRSRDGKAWTPAGGVSGGPVRPILVDPRQIDRLFAVTPQGLMRSLDGGANWHPTAAAPKGAPILSIALDERNALYLGTGRGIWKSTDESATWRSFNDGLVGTTVNTLMVTYGSPRALLAGTQFGLWYSVDQGATWAEAKGMNDPYVLALASDPSAPQWVFAGTWTGAVFYSRDGGMSYTTLGPNPAATTPVSSLALQPTEDGITFYAGTLGSGLYRSGDGGQSWKPHWADAASQIARITALAFVTPTKLYAGTDKGLVQVGPLANPGWTPVVPSVLPPEEVRALYVDKTSGAIFVTLIASGSFRSDDFGEHWTALGKGVFPAQTRFFGLAANVGGQVLYASTDRGMYRSEDGGLTWPPANDGLPPNPHVQTFAIDPHSPQTVYAATNGYGVLQGTDTFRPPVPPWVGWVAAGAGVLLVLFFSIAAWRGRLSPKARARAQARAWPLWDKAITHALWTFGQANEVNLNQMPRRPLPRALSHYMERHPDDGLTLEPSPLTLKLDGYLPAQRFFGHWKAAWESSNDDEAFASITRQMVDQLCDLLGFTYVEDRAFKGLVGYVVRAPALRLKIPRRFPIIFIPRHGNDAPDLTSVRDLMGVLNVTSFFALIVDLGERPDEETEPALKPAARDAIDDFILLGAADVRRLFAARDATRGLMRIILDQADLTVISPYVTNGPVPENMFFGRDYELKTIMRTICNVSFAIVGGRKIGKTSVLSRVYRMLQDAPEFQSFYLDCQAIHSAAEFYDALNALLPGRLPARNAEGLRRALTDVAAARPNGITVLLFDEIDALLRHDIVTGESLFKTLRMLSQEYPLRYVFCGEKVLNGSLRDAHRVFFNFCNALSLSYLAPAEARRVVLEPMQEMGLTLEGNGTLADRIVELTAGHPNLLQYVCQKLVEQSHTRRDRRITRADVEALSQSSQFAEYFAAVSWGTANPLERLICLMMLDRRETTQDEMANLLRACHLKIPRTELEGAFEALELYSILLREKMKYRFAAPAILNVLRRSQDVSGLLAGLVDELKTGRGDSR